MEFNEIARHCIALLNERGVQTQDICDIAYQLQYKYIDDLSMDTVHEALVHVLNKRETQNVVMTGIALDKAIFDGSINDPYLSELVLNDAGLYGVDEVLAYGICNIYGSIALTNFGYVDKIKPGIIASLNDSDHTKVCHTFLDDIVGAIAAAVAAFLAHED